MEENIVIQTKDKTPRTFDFFENFQNWTQQTRSVCFHSFFSRNYIKTAAGTTREIEINFTINS